MILRAWHLFLLFGLFLYGCGDDCKDPQTYLDTARISQGVVGFGQSGSSPDCSMVTLDLEIIPVMGLPATSTAAKTMYEGLSRENIIPVRTETFEQPLNVGAYLVCETSMAGRYRCHGIDLGMNQVRGIFHLTGEKDQFIMIEGGSQVEASLAWQSF